MKRRTKNSVILFLVFFGLLTIGSWTKPSKELSVSEKRPLKQFPSISSESILSGKVMVELEEYVTDQFPMRDLFRKVKSLFATKVLGQQDDMGIYIDENMAIAMEYPLDRKALEKAKDKMQHIQKKYLNQSACSVYYSIIPDKNYYYSQKKNVLAMEYEDLFGYFKEHLDMTYIDITETLQLEKYYRTDSHWRQEFLEETAQKLAKEMGFTLEASYEKIQVKDPFYGVYANQVGIALPPDFITYLTNDMLKQCLVYDYETDCNSKIYNVEKLHGNDKYEIFLSGPVSLMEIKNPIVKNGKELILFRDSFGSSIAPLLAEGYQKITLVDIRYMQSDLLDKWITFENQDILFLYSTSVLNHGELLK